MPGHRAPAACRFGAGAPSAGPRRGAGDGPAPGPLTQIRAALADGRARSVRDLAAVTGLRRDIVEAALDHLVATGRLQSAALQSGCPADACQTCAVRRGCPAAGPGRGRLLTATSVA